jgi:hypothetical protein
MSGKAVVGTCSVPMSRCKRHICSIAWQYWPHDEVAAVADEGGYIAPENLPPDIDYRVRYVYGIQNPRECHKALFYTKPWIPHVGRSRTHTSPPASDN